VCWWHIYNDDNVTITSSREASIWICFGGGRNHDVDGGAHRGNGSAPTGRLYTASMCE
jgi:hypothetical protein